MLTLKNLLLNVNQNLCPTELPRSDTHISPRNLSTECENIFN